MNDLISRQAAIDAIEELISARREWLSANARDEIKGLDAAICEIQNLPAADVPDREVGKWTPVSEGVPKANGRYFVTRGLNACGALWNRVYIINYSNLMGIRKERIWWDGNVGKSDFELITDVLAWMPLPKPWKGGEDE